MIQAWQRLLGSDSPFRVRESHATKTVYSVSYSPVYAGYGNAHPNQASPVGRNADRRSREPGNTRSDPAGPRGPGNLRPRAATDLREDLAATGTRDRDPQLRRLRS